MSNYVEQLAKERLDNLRTVFEGLLVQVEAGTLSYNEALNLINMESVPATKIVATRWDIDDLKSLEGVPESLTDEDLINLLEDLKSGLNDVAVANGWEAINDLLPFYLDKYVKDNDECDICKAVIDEGYSLCDSCNDKVGEWDEKNDAYPLKDGTGSYIFSPSDGCYTLIHGKLAYLYKQLVKERVQ